VNSFCSELALRKWIRRCVGKREELKAVGELRMIFFFFLTFFILVINAVETSIFFNPCVPIISEVADEAILGGVSSFFIYSYTVVRMGPLANQYQSNQAM
jgi:hypothetical protein